MISDYFPKGLTPRESQADILNKLDNLLSSSSTKKFVVLRAPTGSGKSAVCASVSNYFSSRGMGSYLLCSRKYLQSQYMGDFESTYDNFWGKANYRCPLIAASCAGCPADTAIDPAGYMRFLRKNCTTRGPNSKLGNKCPYIIARDKASASSASLLNFEAFMANSPTGHFSKREIMLIDEAHNISDRAASFFEVKVPTWCKVPDSLSKLTYAKDDCRSRLTHKSKEVLDLLEKLQSKHDSLKNEGYPVPMEISSSIQYLSLPGVDWVYDVPRKTLVPVRVKELLDRFLFDYAEKVVLLSATLSPNLCKELGINSKNSTYLDVESDFPLDNNDIRIVPSIGKISANTLPARIYSMAKAIIIARYNNLYTRGVVHTVSYKLVEELKSEMDRVLREEGESTTASPLEDLGFIFHTRDKNLDTLLEEYKSTPGSVLVTPSLSEGFDGRGDLLEWQVLAKCPFPHLGEPRVKSLMATDFGKVLYRERAISTLLQTIGRGLRSKEDKCITYILDKNIVDTLGKCSRKNSEHYTSTSEHFKKCWKRKFNEEWLS